MEARQQTEDPVRQEGAAAPGTLGDVLYQNRGKRLVPESEWAQLVLSVAAGEETALHRLYERSGHLVFTLAVRIVGNRESAEEVTLDVFHDVWRRASAYHPSNGTVLGWIMNQARSRAIDRVRFEHRAKRVEPRDLAPGAEGESPDPRVLLELKQGAETVRAALAVLTADERRVIEAAYFAGLTHAEIAARFGEPLGTVKTRIRAGVEKLRRAMNPKEPSR